MRILLLCGYMHKFSLQNLECGILCHGKSEQSAKVFSVKLHFFRFVKVFSLESFPLCSNMSSATHTTHSHMQCKTVCPPFVWSEWSPCSKACGQGRRYRKAIYDFVCQASDKCPLNRIEESICDVPCKFDPDKYGGPGMVQRAWQKLSSVCVTLLFPSLSPHSLFLCSFILASSSLSSSSLSLTLSYLPSLFFFLFFPPSPCGACPRSACRRSAV